MCECMKFAKIDSVEQKEIIQDKKLCFGCLKVGHIAKSCKNRATCKTCNGKHPTSMHRKKVESNGPEPVSSDTGAGNENMTCNTNTGFENEFCTMAIVPVSVRLKGKAVHTYAFIDSGSSTSFMSEKLANQLNAKGKTKQITLNTLGKRFSIDSKLVNGLEISDLKGQNLFKLPTVFTKRYIPVSKSHIPTNQDLVKWSHLSEVNLPQIDGDIGLLLGNNIPDVCAPLEVKRGESGSPMAIRSPLGWIVYNLVRNSEYTSHVVNRACIVSVQESNELQRIEYLYRESVNLDFPERVIDEKREHSQEDKRFLEQVKHTQVKIDNHYEIGLPLRQDVELPENKFLAEQRLKSLKRKLNNSPKFKTDYLKFMNDLFEKGYVEIVPNAEIVRDDGRVWYLPHHGVYNPNKPDKIRVVFDCSAKCQGVSLNDKLLQGPNLTNSLIGVLLRFRQEPIAVMGDIEAMFHQVRVRKQDRDYLRFLWWVDGDLNKEPVVCRATVHIFGATSSPSCAISALKATAEENKGSFDEETVQTVLKNSYVDDFLKSVPNEKQAIELIKQLQELCSLGGFRLTKWISNSRMVLDSISNSDKSKTVIQLDLDSQSLPVEKALGVYWCVERDCFSFRINVQSRPLTRRGVLSITSSVFDPLGLASPFILPAKMILQELCRKGLGWDDPLPDEELQRWETWLSELQCLEQINIPRCLAPKTDQRVKYELHVFCDASEKAYGVVCYIRAVTGDDVKCTLVMSKSRVTPLKKVSIVRLELMACALGVKIAKMIQDELEVDLTTHYWTDSMSVLKYIANEKTRFHTFVANRVSLIREATNISQWKHISSKLNPADLASRGLSPKGTSKSEVWFNGPEFLRKPGLEVPNSENHDLELSQNDPEVKHVNVVSRVDLEGEEQLFGRFSNWRKMVRVFGNVLKFVFNTKNFVQKRKELERIGYDEQNIDQVMQNLKQAKPQDNHILSPEDLKGSEMFIIRRVQDWYFADEIHALTNETSVSKTSPTFKVDPFMEEGVLRVGGRLSRSELDYDAKHPILLPRQSTCFKVTRASCTQEGWSSRSELHGCTFETKLLDHWCKRFGKRCSFRVRNMQKIQLKST